VIPRPFSLASAQDTTLKSNGLALTHGETKARELAGARPSARDASALGAIVLILTFLASL
jgi:hypothetical protein